MMRVASVRRIATGRSARPRTKRREWAGAQRAQHRILAPQMGTGPARVSLPTTSLVGGCPGLLLMVSLENALRILGLRALGSARCR